MMQMKKLQLCFLLFAFTSCQASTVSLTRAF